MTNYIIEEWWRHLGCYDRELISYFVCDGDVPNYLTMTDEWWETLSDEEKEEYYEEFFDEN